MKKLIVFHLLNDYSGSPQVLKTALAALMEKGINLDLVTSRGGVLDELKTKENIHFYHFAYSFHKNCILTLMNFTFAQFYLFFFSFRYIFQKDIIFYINTILPIGASLAGRIIGKKVVYHYHENAFAKSVFYRVLCKFMQALASEIICVSEYQRSFLGRQKNVTVIPNSLPETFCNVFEYQPKQAFEYQTVLMLSSLKRYKGILDFVKLSEKLPQYRFKLIINDTNNNIQNFLFENKIEKTNNLIIFERQDNVITFYKQASIVLNLSNRRQVIETFGMTILEALTAGLPVIVPSIGGIAEMIIDGFNGYKIDVEELNKIENYIARILSDWNLYQELSENAFKTAKIYTYKNMICQIMQVIENNN